MTQSDRILNILQERGSEGVTNVELNRDLSIYRLWENAPAYPKPKFILYDGLHGMNISL